MILDSLSRVQVNESLLRSTKVGVVVGKLRKHTNSDIAERSQQVVNKWRRLVRRESVQEQSAPSSKETKETTSNRPPPLQRSQSGSSLGGPPSPGASTRERTVGSDDVTYTKTGNPVRNKMIEMFYSALAKNSTADSERIITKAIAVEAAIFKQFGSPDAAYRARVRELYLNLKGDDNPALREAIVSGELLPERFCTMTSEELMSEEQRQQELKIHEENLFKARGAAQQEASTDAFKCPRCKQRKCTYFQMQTRSADEPMTTFVTCVVCDNRWKFC
jgi:transcription elongation factor S-II